MATITEILNDTNPETSAKQKVTAIAAIVDEARKTYGNSDLDIEAKDIFTTDGVEALDMLSYEDKLALIESEIRNVKTVATEFCNSFEGAVISKKVVELIAISPLLVNIMKTRDLGGLL